MKKLIIFILVALFTISVTAQTEGPKPKKKSGYNYKAHQKRNAKYKRNNERGNYMKCKKKH